MVRLYDLDLSSLSSSFSVYCFLMRSFRFKFWLGGMLLSVICGYSQKIPQTEITNGLVKARLYLPDVDDGYYRATRFDWSGVIPHLEHEGHSYFGKWFKNYDPKNHESIMGPVDEFSPIGYDDVGVGESFIKIGVGALIKKQEERYNKFKPYTISDYGEWEISESSNEVTFKHTLNTSNHSYSYVKVINLPPGKSEMIVRHELTNTGRKNIETQVYNHNFFNIDSVNIGKAYVVKFPFNIVSRGREKGIGEIALIEQNQIRFIKELQEGKQVYLGSITGYEENAKAYEVTIENIQSGAGVKIQGNRPLSKLVFWSAHKTICPEPYINVNVEPGETFTWEIVYTFYSL